MFKGGRNLSQLPPDSYNPNHTFLPPPWVHPRIALRGPPMSQSEKRNRNERRRLTRLLLEHSLVVLKRLVVATLHREKYKFNPCLVFP